MSMVLLPQVLASTEGDVAEPTARIVAAVKALIEASSR
jgi:hypothetical protein